MATKYKNETVLTTSNKEEALKAFDEWSGKTAIWIKKTVSVFTPNNVSQLYEVIIRKEVE